MESSWLILMKIKQALHVDKIICYYNSKSSNFLNMSEKLLYYTVSGISTKFVSSVPANQVDCG